MNKIMLISDNEEVFHITEEIMQGKYELIWCKHDFWGMEEYLDVNGVIMHFDNNMTEQGVFEEIIRAKGKLGHYIPILALVEKGTPQDIFSILGTGIYDYLEITSDMQRYRKKIDELVLWNWYLKKYMLKEQQQ